MKQVVQKVELPKLGSISPFWVPRHVQQCDYRLLAYTFSLVYRCNSFITPWETYAIDHAEPVRSC